MADKMEVDEKKAEGKEEKKQESAFLRVDWPDFDVELYASRYKGKVKVDRMIHIANVNAAVRGKALAIAVEEVRNMIDVGLYDAVTEKAQAVLGDKAPMDPVWMSQTSQENDKKVRHLEDEIQRWRNLSNREKICQAYIDAGRFYTRIGSYTTAISRFIEAKSYASDTKLLFDLNLRIITASMQSGNLSHVKSEASHALNSVDGHSSPQKRSKAAAATGVYFLRTGRYEGAVNYFIDCNFALSGAWPEALAGHDIALYGGLCALASFPRSRLKSQVLDNAEFKRYLELKPAVLRLVRGFYESEYGSVMSGLNELKRELVSDMYLYSNVESLLSAIRGKALVQYFSPYSAMDMKKMAQSFNVTLEEMERELSSCIADGHINAKIDSHSKIVYASTKNKRTKLFQDVLRMGEEFAFDMKAVLLRMSLQQENCIVSQNRELFLEYGGDLDEGKGMMGAVVGMGQKFFRMGAGRRG